MSPCQSRHLIRSRSASSRVPSASPRLGHALGVLAEHGQPHGDVEPVQHVLAAGADQLRERLDLVAPVGQERDVLVRLQPLARQDLEQPTLRFPVVTVHEAEIAGLAILRHRAADDDLEVAGLLAPVADVAAVQPDHDPPLRGRQLLPVGRAAVDEAGPLLAELGLGPLGDPQHVRADGAGVDRGPDRQDVGEQPGRGGVGHERGPAGLEVEPLRRDVVREQVLERRERRRPGPAPVAPAAVEARAREADVAEERAEHDRVAALGAEALPAGRAVPVLPDVASAWSPTRWRCRPPSAALPSASDRPTSSSLSAPFSKVTTSSAGPNSPSSGAVWSRILTRTASPPAA